MKKILFFIHDLGQGGAEKVLVNLVNNMDITKFDITVMALFAGGTNEQFLNKNIRYITIFPKTFPGNSHVMKLFSPRLLHKLFIKERYDIEISYLEGPSARIISGCSNEKTKLVSWIHTEISDMKELAKSFRNENEAKKCYERFDKMVFVSESIKNKFCRNIKFSKTAQVLYNTVESEKIKNLSEEVISEILYDDNEIRIVAVGTLKKVKGYERLLKIINKLSVNYNIHLYILGVGPLKCDMEKYIEDNKLENSITLLGYHTNPYKFIRNSDLFVCSSYIEGFSTATTESLIIGTPVCTVEVSGMKELLGENSEYGLITKNDEESLYNGIKSLLDNPQRLNYYREKAFERGKRFSTGKTVDEVQRMFEKLTEGVDETK